MEWSEETIARLRVLWDEGHSTAEIGRKLGVTKNAVVGKAHRLELPARPSPIRQSSDEARSPRRTERRRPPAPPSLPSLPLRSLAVASAPPQPAATVLRAVPSLVRPATRTSSCCWPIGEPGTREFRFCSEAAVTGKPYCAEHVAVAYVRVRDRREDAA